jgi:hypothetical protein
MTVMVYDWHDASAPSLTGEVGSLIALLDACLVNGYGSKAAAGWTKPYTGTNVAAFRQGGASSTKAYIRINDNAPLNAEDARIRAYDSMTDIDTGSGDFPTVALRANGIFMKKSSSADSTKRPWTVVADDRTFYLIVWYQSVLSGTLKLTSPSSFMGFGDFDSYKPGDTDNQFLSARSTEDSLLETMDIVGSNLTYIGSVATAFTYTKKNYSGLSPSAVNFVTWNYSMASATLDALLPNNADGRFYVSPGYLMQDISGTYVDMACAGKLRGLYQQCRIQDSATYSLNHGRVISDGSKDYRMFIGFTGYHFAIEVSDTW